MAFTSSRAALATVFTLLLVACSAQIGASPKTSQVPTASSASTTSQPPTPSPTSTSAGQSTAASSPGAIGASPMATDYYPVDVTSPAQAAALVFSTNERFAEMLPMSLPSVGSSSSYTASDNGSGFSVSVTMGSGDCESGCMDSHTWNYSVSHDGHVELVSEQGDPVEGPSPTQVNAPATVTIRLVAGPVCPVEQNPPNPNCAPRPIADTEIVVRDPSGTEFGRKSTDASGMAVFVLMGGAYYAEPAVASGPMRQAEPTAFSVIGGSTVSFALEYDTGIR